MRWLRKTRATFTRQRFWAYPRKFVAFMPRVYTATTKYGVNSGTFRIRNKKWKSHLLLLGTSPCKRDYRLWIRWSFASLLLFWPSCRAWLACIRQRITRWWPAVFSLIEDGDAWCIWPYFCHVASLQEDEDDGGDSGKGQEGLRVGGRTLLTAQSCQKSGRRTLGCRRITSNGYAQS